MRTGLPIGTHGGGEAAGDLELAILSMAVALRDRGAGRSRRRRWGAEPRRLLGRRLRTGGTVDPGFWFGIMLILLFSVSLGRLPAGGFVPPVFESRWGNLDTMLMPSLVLGTATAAIIMRHVRSSMLTGAAAGLRADGPGQGRPERIVVVRHALRERR